MAWSARGTGISATASHVLLVAGLYSAHKNAVFWNVVFSRKMFTFCRTKITYREERREPCPGRGRRWRRAALVRGPPHAESGCRRAAQDTLTSGPDQAHNTPRLARHPAPPLRNHMQLSSQSGGTTNKILLLGGKNSGWIQVILLLELITKGSSWNWLMIGSWA